MELKNGNESHNFVFNSHSFILNNDLSYSDVNQGNQAMYLFMSVKVTFCLLQSADKTPCYKLFSLLSSTPPFSIQDYC